jgi:hypothetical protein
MRKLSKKDQEKIKKATKFELSPQCQIKEFEKEINIILKALGYDPYEALITDESFISDFMPFLGSMGRKEEFKKFEKKMNKLGIKVDWLDSVIDVAKKLRDRWPK